jgi:hypothetical protein
MVAAGLQRIDLGQVVHQIAVRPVDLEGDIAAAVAGQVEAGLLGKTGELPENEI